MSTLKDLMKAKIRPTDVLVFYKPDVNLHGDGEYVEHRKVRNGKMEAGHPLTIEDFTKLVATVSKYAKKDSGRTALHGVIPPTLLFASSDLTSKRLVWWRPPEKRMAYFTKDTGIPNGELWVPGLVYVASSSGLNMFAFKGKKPRSILYRAPFFNVNGSVCLGSAKVRKPKDDTYEAWIDYWEQMFWKSEFSHIWGENPINGNLAVITKQCIKEGKPFPAEVLIRSKTILGSLLK
jgi:PRTRC genetic system protein B